MGTKAGNRNFSINHFQKDITRSHRGERWSVWDLFAFILSKVKREIQNIRKQLKER